MNKLNDLVYMESGNREGDGYRRGRVSHDFHIVETNACEVIIVLFIGGGAGERENADKVARIISSNELGEAFLADPEIGSRVDVGDSPSIDGVISIDPLNRVISSIWPAYPNPVLGLCVLNDEEIISVGDIISETEISYFKFSIFGIASGTLCVSPH